ncbi:hypothetical protein OS493_027159 [Desmophyllum pertusum]|uniref:Ankyrin repeat protein n=1 Tax=Desmophyllum pertusum TaxID=174260 RepID=A0A9W9ZYC7_9CNID|nr:hypothetical protein OS493_027159 [Desmophyllum pertusum]
MAMKVSSNICWRSVLTSIATDHYGNTPVKLAAEKGNISVVKLLMEKGADITIADKVGGHFSSVEFHQALEIWTGIPPYSKDLDFEFPQEILTGIPPDSRDLDWTSEICNEIPQDSRDLGYNSPRLWRSGLDI